MNSTVAMKMMLNDTDRRVVRHLKGRTKPLSAYDIKNALQIRYPPTVYRALDKLLQLGLVHRIESANAFVACVKSEHSHSPGFIVCAECGATQEFAVEALLPILQSEAAERHFSMEKTTIELVGRCSNCVRKAKWRARKIQR
jgi:Fur family zinc uptake transcriptional regulator